MTPKIDCHLHTTFSSDGFNSPREVITRAIEMGIQHICITDHVDYLYSDPSFKSLDTELYLLQLRQLQSEFANKIYVAVGIEVGYTKDNYLLNTEALKKLNFDYIISSIHEVDGSDCYYPHHYEGRERELVYNNYFNAVYESICVPYKVHAVGHLAYVSRTAPYPNKLIKKGEFDSVLTKIFAKMISDNLILELNTNVYNAGTLCLPNLPLLEKYVDAGGKLVCFSSDAHKTIRIGDHYPEVAKMCLTLGIKNWSIIQNKTLTQIKI